MFEQVYAPLGNIYLSALFAAIPIIVLLVMLGVLRTAAHWAALVVATHIEGHDLPSIAQRTGTPVRTLQWRRRKAEVALAAEAAA